jgi:uncharacterized membrane protein YqjE
MEPAMSDRYEPATAPADPSTSELVSRMTEQMSQLVRDELRLAQLELREKGKRAGIGAGLFGGAGVVALYAVAALVTCAILLLGLAIPYWLAALIVGVVLLAVAGVLALLGRKQMRRAAPPVPQQAVAGIKRDVETVKERAQR